MTIRRRAHASANREGSGPTTRSGSAHGSRAWWIAAAGLALLAAVALGWWRLREPTEIVIADGSLRGSNVLLITIDTLRADRLGAYGNANGLTPTLDRLSAEGLRFDAAYSSVPLTLPAHASILTGLEPFSHGVRNNTSFRLGDTPTLATALKAAGYRTGAFIGAFVLNGRFGLARGFDVYDDRYGHLRSEADFHIAERPADRVMEPAIQWILQPKEPEARPGHPWFAWIHLYDPHAPYQAPPAYRENRSLYDAEVAYVDATIGRALDQLRAARALDRTVIVVTADHGESLGEHGESTHGLFAYNSTLHVPLIVAGPGVPARRVQSPVGHVDIAPTIFAWLGVAAPGRLDGRPLLSPQQLPDNRALYFEALDANLTRGWAPLMGVTTGRWKYTDLPIPELYDLGHDPAESLNLAGSDPDRVRQMRSRLAALTNERRPAAGGASEPDAETARRLASLGYVGSLQPGRRRDFSNEDDPKRLVELNELFNTAITDYGDGRSDDALQKLRSVLSKRPDFLAARTSAAAILTGTGRAKEAIALLRLAPEPGQSSATVQTKLGLAHDAAGNLTEAARCLENAVRLRAGDTEALNGLGVVYARMKRFDDGRRTLQAALALDASAPGVWNNLGILEMSAGRPHDAATAFRQAVKIDSDFAAAWQGLGAAIVADDPKGAVAAWERTVTLDPQDFDTLYNLGVVLANGPSPADALLYLKRFVATAPRSRYGPDIARLNSMIRRIERR